jgi:hypothetical protein
MHEKIRKDGQIGHFFNYMAFNNISIALDYRFNAVIVSGDDGRVWD